MLQIMPDTVFVGVAPPVPVDTIRLIGDWKSNAYTSYLQISDELIFKAVQQMSQIPTL